MQNIIQSTEETKPWHSHPLVWMMISIPFSAVVMGVVMIWLAVDTDDGLVADDYYKRGLAINDVISLDKRAAELQLNATINFNSDVRIINVQFDKGLLKEYPETMQLSFQHATRANSDVLVTLDHGIDNKYIGLLKQNISQGIWYFEISGKEVSDNGRADKDWKLNTRTHVGSENNVHLESGYY